MQQKIIRVGVVGLGMGREHIALFNEQSRSCVAAVCDVDHKLLARVAGASAIDHSFDSLEDMIAADVVDAVSLAVPNDLHAPMAIRSLEAGLHVLCEKPLARNADEAGRIVDAARSAKRKLGVHFNMRMCREHQFVRSVFDAGQLGRILHIRTGWTRQRGIPDWGAGWFCQRERSGGGVLIDVGVHMIDAALWACGFPDVVGVSGQTHRAFSDRDVPDQDVDVEDSASGYLRCANGTTISLEVSWAGFDTAREVVFCSVLGDKAGVHWRWIKDGQSAWKRRLTMIERSHGAVTRRRIVDYPKVLPTVQSDFIQSIIDDREPLCSGSQGLELMRILDALYESSRVGAEIRLR